MNARTVVLFAVVAGLSAAGGVLYHLGSRGSAGPGGDPAEVLERILAAPHTDVKGEARRLGVPVDRGHAEPAGACLLDRSALMTPGAHEEDGLHGRRC